MIGIRHILEIEAWDGEQIITLRYASGEFTTTANETPANTLIAGGIIDPGLLKYSMFSGGKTFGASSYSFGEVVLSNYKRTLDFMKGYSFDGRTIRLYEAPLGSLFPAQYTIIYTATIERITFGIDDVKFSLKGKQLDLSVPVPSGTFAGDNVGASGVEGGEDLKGKPKPFLLGRAFNLTPIQCNTSKLIFAVSPATGVAAIYMGSLFAVYDGGLELQYEGTYVDQADMEANAPSPGKYKVWEQGGYFRLGSSPAGVITCDAASYGRSVTAKPGNLISDLLTLVGADYNAASINALNAGFRAECGVFLGNGEPVSAALDLICSACGAYWYFDANGTLFVGQFVDPVNAVSDYTINTGSTIVSKATIKSTQDTQGGIPAHIVTLLRSKNETTQTEVFGRVTEARKVWLKEQWRKTQIVNPEVKTNHPLSEELKIETSLTQENTEEATRRAALYSVQRDLIDIDVPIDTFGHTSNIRPGMIVTLVLEDTTTQVLLHRFGYVSKKMAVVGYIENRISEKLTLSLWG